MTKVFHQDDIILAIINTMKDIPDDVDFDGEDSVKKKEFDLKTADECRDIPEEFLSEILASLSDEFLSECVGREIMHSARNKTALFIL